MPKNKNYSTRLRILDRYLGSGKAYSGNELMGFINRELKLRGEPPITSRTTLMGDLINIENEYRVNIVREKQGRITTYKYKDPNFSIYNNDLSEEDYNHLGQALFILERFEGMPQFDWMTKLSTSLHLQMTNGKQVKSIVSFESSSNNKGMENFTPLFDAIHNKTTVKLRYKSFDMCEPQTIIVHPYYLKQYNNRWFLFCCTGNYTNISNYPLDRILNISLANVPYRDTNIDFNEYFEDMIGVTKREGQLPDKILLKFPAEEYPYVATKPWHRTQRIVSKDEHSVTIELDVVINYELEQKILSWGDYIEVLQPENLRNIIKARINAAASLYETKK